MSSNMAKMVQMRSVANNLYKRYDELKTMDSNLENENEMFQVIEMMSLLLPKLKKLEYEYEYDMEPSINKLFE